MNLYDVKNMGKTAVILNLGEGKRMRLAGGAKVRGITLQRLDTKVMKAWIDGGVISVSEHVEDAPPEKGEVAAPKAVEEIKAKDAARNKKRRAAE